MCRRAPRLRLGSAAAAAVAQSVMGWGVLLRAEKEIAQYEALKSRKVKGQPDLGPASRGVELRCAPWKRKREELPLSDLCTWHRGSANADADTRRLRGRARRPVAHAIRPRDSTPVGVRTASERCAQRGRADSDAAQADRIFRDDPVAFAAKQARSLYRCSARAAPVSPKVTTAAAEPPSDVRELRLRLAPSDSEPAHTRAHADTASLLGHEL